MDIESAKKIIESLKDSAKQSESKEEKKDTDQDKDKEYEKLYKQNLILKRKLKILEVDYANFELCIEENERLKQQLKSSNKEIVSNLKPELLPATNDDPRIDYEEWLGLYIYQDMRKGLPAIPSCELCLTPLEKLGDFEKHLFEVHNVQSRMFILESDIPIEQHDEEEGSVDPADHGGMKFH